MIIFTPGRFSLLLEHVSDPSQDSQVFCVDTVVAVVLKGSTNESRNNAVQTEDDSGIIK